MQPSKPSKAMLKFAAQLLDEARSSDNPCVVLDNDAQRVRMRYDSIQVHVPTAPGQPWRVAFSWRGQELWEMAGLHINPGEILNLTGIEGSSELTLSS
ncbi:MAG: hypothetical protein KAX77_01250 [Xanthomonadales bacterium]|nr:hypothetical protein [Xanthomonadales bacterium]